MIIISALYIQVAITFRESRTCSVVTQKKKGYRPLVGLGSHRNNCPYKSFMFYIVNYHIVRSHI